MVKEAVCSCIFLLYLQNRLVKYIKRIFLYMNIIQIKTRKKIVQMSCTAFIVYTFRLSLHHAKHVLLLFLFIGYRQFTSVTVGSYQFTLVHIGSRRFTSIHIGSRRFTSVHIGSHRFTSIHIGSHRFTSFRVGSHRFT